jgi:hypothetical protein
MGVPVVTSLGLPRWRAESQQWARCWLLTPTPTLFHTSDEDEFARGYLERLNRFGPQKIARTLEHIAREHQAQRLVLLCHEVNPATCHRGLFAAWLLEQTGELAPDLT